MTLKNLILWCVASAALWAGIGTAVAVVADSTEGDTFGNCHVYGNRHCGASAPWHGFVGTGE